MDEEHLIIAKLLTGFSTPAFQNKPETSKNFEWVRDVALYQLASQLLQSVNLLSHAIRESYPSKKSSLVNEHTGFSWDVKDFLERQAETGTLLSVLERVHTPDELMAQKMCADMQELTKYIKIIFQYYLQHVDTSTLDLKAFLNKTFDLTKIYRKLRQDFTKNEKEWNKLALAKNTYKFLGNVRQALSPTEESEPSNQDNLMEQLENNYAALLTNDNLEQTIELSNQNINHIQAEIEHYNKLLNREQSAFASICEIRKAEIENYKQRLVALHSDFESRREELDSQNRFLKQSIEKLGELRQFFEESLTNIRLCLKSWQEENVEEETEIKTIKRSTVKEASPRRSPRRRNPKRTPSAKPTRQIKN